MSRRVVLLTGASGLVGTWLRRTVPADVELVSLVHRTPVPGAECVTADLRDGEAVAAAFALVRPSMVVHAAMAIDAASIVGATEHVVQSAAVGGADVVHVSTEAVFGGDGRPLDEEAQPDPIWAYGRWKAEAERVVLRGSPGAAIVRLPLVVSVDPEDGAVARIRRGALAGQPTGWFDDEIRQPAMGSDVADGLWRITALAADRRNGPWHLGGPESLSRYEIARRVADRLGLDRSTVEPVPTPTDAVRPRHLDLRSERAQGEIGWDPAPVLT